MDRSQSQPVKVFCSQMLILVGTSTVSYFPCIMNAPARPSVRNSIFKTMIERVPEAPSTVICVFGSFFQQQNPEPALTTSNYLVDESQSSTTSSKHDCIPDLRFSQPAHNSSADVVVAHVAGVSPLARFGYRIEIQTNL